MTVVVLLFYYHMIVRGLFKYIVVILMYVLTELGYVLICQVKEKEKKSFENALVEKSEYSTRNKNGLVDGL